MSLGSGCRVGKDIPVDQHGATLAQRVGNKRVRRGKVLYQILILDVVHFNVEMLIAFKQRLVKWLPENRHDVRDTGSLESIRGAQSKHAADVEGMAGDLIHRYRRHCGVESTVVKDPVNEDREFGRNCEGGDGVVVVMVMVVMVMVVVVEMWLAIDKNEADGGGGGGGEAAAAAAAARAASGEREMGCGRTRRKISPTGQSKGGKPPPRAVRLVKAPEGTYEYLREQVSRRAETTWRHLSAIVIVSTS